MARRTASASRRATASVAAPVRTVRVPPPTPTRYWKPRDVRRLKYRLAPKEINWADSVTSETVVPPDSSS